MSDEIILTLVQNLDDRELEPDKIDTDGQAKYDVCKHISVFMHKKGLTPRELAKKMDIPETRVSEIVHYKIGKFTLDHLVSSLFHIGKCQIRS